MTWDDDRSAIEDHYSDVPEEDRLRTLARLEFLRTIEILQRHLPPAPAVIADIGGGPGTYAIPLTLQGYTVWLLDPLKKHIDRALERSREANIVLGHAQVGHACELPWGDASVDACLLFGPMYHLTSQVDRSIALTEARRVLRQEGLLVATAISRYASTFAGLYRGLLSDPEFRKIAESDRQTGQHRNPSKDPRWFTTAFYHHPMEFAHEIGNEGFEVLELLAVDGPGGYLNNLSWWLDDDDRRQTLLSTVRQVEKEASILGASPQLMTVARKQ